jgi:hypothetical protein
VFPVTVRSELQLWVHLLERNSVPHEHSRVPRWAQAQEETYEAAAAPGPEALLGCDGLREVRRRAVVTAADWACGNNRRAWLVNARASQAVGEVCSAVASLQLVKEVLKLC